MSSVNGVNGLDGNLYEILLQTTKNKQETDPTTTAIAGAGAVGGVTGGNEQGIDNLRNQIDTAVSDALAGLDKSSSVDEIKNAIKKAVDSTLKANGIDPDKMPVKKHRRPHAPKGSSKKSGDNGADDTDNTDSVTDDPFTQKLQDLLDKNGFDGKSVISQIEAEMSQQGTKSMFAFMQGIQSQQGVDATA